MPSALHSNCVPRKLSEKEFQDAPILNGFRCFCARYRDSIEGFLSPEIKDAQSGIERIRSCDASSHTPLFAPDIHNEQRVHLSRREETSIKPSAIKIKSKSTMTKTTKVPPSMAGPFLFMVHSNITILYTIKRMS